MSHSCFALYLIHFSLTHQSLALSLVCLSVLNIGLTRLLFVVLISL